MYRHLINKTKASKQLPESDRSTRQGHRRKSVASRDSNTQYQDGNNELRSVFNDLVATEEVPKPRNFFGIPLSGATTVMSSTVVKKNVTSIPEKRTTHNSNSYRVGERSSSHLFATKESSKSVMMTQNSQQGVVMKEKMAQTMHQFPRIDRAQGSSMPKLEKKLSRSQLSQGRNMPMDNSFNDYAPASNQNMAKLPLATCFNFRSKDPKLSAGFQNMSSSRSLTKHSKHRHLQPQAFESLNSSTVSSKGVLAAEARQSTRSFTANQLFVKKKQMANKSLLTFNTKLHQQQQPMLQKPPASLKSQLLLCQQNSSSTLQKPNLDLVLVQNSPLQQRKMQHTKKRAAFQSNERLTTVGIKQTYKPQNLPLQSPSRFKAKKQHHRVASVQYQTEPDLVMIQPAQSQRLIKGQPDMDVDEMELPRMQQSQIQLDDSHSIQLGQRDMEIEPDLSTLFSKKVVSPQIFGAEIAERQLMGPLSDTDREKMEHIIDHLDLEETIRCKARLYFNNEQARLKREDEPASRHGFFSISSNMQQPNMQINTIPNNSQEQLVDSALIENTCSQRQVTTQHEIKRKIHRMSINNEIERNDLRQEQFQTQDMATPKQNENQRQTKSIERLISSSVHQGGESWFNKSKQSKSSQMMSLRRHSRDARNVIVGDHKNEMQISEKQKLVAAIYAKDDEEMGEEHRRLLEISRDYHESLSIKRGKKQWKNQPGTSSTKRGEKRQKLTGIKRDYCEKVLGEYRFGLHQKAPLSTDPDAPATERFSQLAEYRFADNNKRFMELYENQMQELRRTRHFLADQICKSPDGRNYASQIHAESPLMNKLNRQIHQKLIEQTIQEQIDEVKKRQFEQQLGGLTDLKMQHQQELENITQQIKDHIDSIITNDPQESQLSHLLGLQKNKMEEMTLIKQTIDQQIATVEKTQGVLQTGGLLELQQRKNAEAEEWRPSSDFEDAKSNEASSKPSSSSSMRRINLIKKQEFDNLLCEESIDSGDAQAQRKLQLSVQDILKGQPILDIHRDFVDRADEAHKRRLDVTTYEMDQLITDQYYGNDQQKMGLSLCYNQQEADQQNNFKEQKKQVANYLNILFGGNKSTKEFEDMSKNLIRQLSRQKTDDSNARERARDIQEDAIAGIDVDQEDVNTEIITMIADEILRKAEFFKMFKSNVRGKNDLIHDAQKGQMEQQIARTSTASLKCKRELFHRVNALTCQAQELAVPQKVEETPRLDSFIVKDHMVRKKNTFFRQIATVDTTHETDMKTIQDVKNEQAKARFIEQCQKNLVVTIPLLLRIKDKMINLTRYQLNNGLCKALSLALMQFPDIATDFHFEANNFLDDDFAVLLEGMQELTIVNGLTYKHNMFGKKSLEALIPIIRREQTQTALRSLHLVHCKITAKVTKELLCALSQQKNRIRSLSLVNVNLNQSNYLDLCQLIRVSRGLQDLDISWNQMRCQQMYELIDVISENRSLQNLNLSYNNLHNPLQAKYAESTPFSKVQNQAKQLAIQQKQKRAKTLAQKAQAEYEGMDLSMQHILKLCKFIKMNSKLMHLNLSGMGMTQPMMNQFGRALRRTKSMISLHLSGNNGDNESLRMALVERGHIKPFEAIVRPDLHALKIKTNQKDADTKQFRLEDAIVIGDKGDGSRFNPRTAKISEQLNLKNMLKNKKGQCNRQIVETDASQMLIFTRYLGHKIEMPGSEQWRMIATSNDEQERCWVCNQEVYSLVFWSREFGFKTQQELETLGLDELACENQLYDLELLNRQRGISVDYHADAGNPQLYEAAHKLAGFPLIYGDFNNWKPQRMYTIEELCYILDSSKPDILGNLKKSRYVKQNVQTVDDMNKKERAMYDDRVKSLMTNYSRMHNWRKLLGMTLKYKRPFMANAEALLLSNPSVKISKMDEELYPSDSQSELGSSSDGDSKSSANKEKNDEPSSEDSRSSEQKTTRNSASSPYMRQSTQKTIATITKLRTQLNKQLYVIPCFLKPGKTTFIVQAQVCQNQNDTSMQSQLKTQQSLRPSQLKKTNNPDHSPGKTSKGAMNSQEDDYDSQFFFHSVLAPMRRERVPLIVKQLARKTNEENKFNKNNTVFKDWRTPTDKDFDKMIDHDSKLWNIPRFIKDQSMLKQVYAVFRKYIRKLFYIMISVMSNSNFPAITWLDFSKFSEVCQTSDNKNISQKDVDRFFLASCGGAKDAKYRYQFLEAIMRIADFKFQQPGISKNHADALRMFLEEHCLKYGPVDEWHHFRESIWWKYEHHRIIHANLAQIKKVFNSFFEPRKKYMNKADCIDFMTKHTRIIIDEKKVIYCFGMSQMVVIADTNADREQFDEMKFVEFLEFIARCAYAKYKEYTDMTMADKLITFLDEMLPMYGCTRQEVLDEEEELSESDPDY